MQGGAESELQIRCQTLALAHTSTSFPHIAGMDLANDCLNFGCPRFHTLPDSVQSGADLVIDLDFGDFMNEGEMKHLYQQVG